jgi:hypothetical protein
VVGHRGRLLFDKFRIFNKSMRSGDAVASCPQRAGIALYSRAPYVN